MSKTITAKNLIRSLGLAALVGVALWGAPTLAQKQGLARETLEQLVTVPPGDLSDDDLALRIQLNRRLIKDNISEIGGIKLKALLKADRKEKRQRNSTEAAAPEAPAFENKTDEIDAAALEAEKKQAQEQAAAAKKAERDQLRQQRKAEKAKAAQEAAEKDRLAKANAAKQLEEADKKRIADEKSAAAAAQKAEQKATQKKTTKNPRINRLARKSLEDKRPSNRLNVPQLTARVAEADNLLRDNGLRSRLASSLQDRMVQDRAVLQRKTERQRIRAQKQEAERKAAEAAAVKRNNNTNRAQAPQTNNKRANKRARDLLLDKRTANTLGLPELKDRVQRTRDALQREGLRPRLNQKLLNRLGQDRDELRNRVAVNQGRNPNNQVRKRILENRSIRDGFLSDRRNARRLDENQLDQRIEQAVTLLDGMRMRPATRSGVKKMLQRDRAEKRNRLLTAREERRKNLRRQGRRPNGFSIEFGNSGIRFNSDIVAAEEDNEALQQQLLAPPRQQIQRRYTLNEFRARPELRQYMPGIELDTIRFGTNEAYIRAEEVGNLDGIGEIIEQIVFSEPGEVFLIEGHTDAVGSDGYNFTLSAARAEGVREALLDYFNIPAQNLIAIGYGESYLRIPTPRAEQENRRVSVRRITPLLAAR